MTAVDPAGEVRARLDRLDALRAAGTDGPWWQDDEWFMRDGKVIGRVLSYDPDTYEKPAAALIVAVVNAQPALTAAIRAVFDLHEPGPGDHPACQECSDPESASTVPWPCSTTTATTAALDREEIR